MLTYDLHVLMGNENAESMATIKCHDTSANLRIYPEILKKISKWRTITQPYTIPDGSIALMKVKKADNTYVLTEAKEVTKDSIYFEPHKQTFTAAGKAEAEVNIYGPDMRRITSGTFYLDVSQECADNCAEDSQTYVDVMAAQIQAAVDAAERSELAAKRAEEAAGAEPGGTYAEMQEAIDALEDVCFETVETVSVNKFNPDTVEQTSFSGYSCYVSEMIPCSVGDVFYFQRLTDGKLVAFSGGIQLVDESGATALVGLAHYASHTVENHVNTPNLVGARIIVQESVVTYDNRDTIMVTINEKPTEFSEHIPGSSVKVDRLEKHRTELQEQIDATNEKVKSLEEQTEPEGAHAEMQEAIDALEDVCFETDETVSVNKFNPDTVEQTSFSGYSCYVSEMIPCSVGDVFYFRRLTDGKLVDFGGGIQLVDESGSTALVGLSHYATYTVEEHVNTPNLAGARIIIKESVVTYDNRDTIMVTINEKPTEFSEHIPGSSVKVDRLEKHRTELQEQIDATNEKVKSLEEQTEPGTTASSRWNGKNVLVFGDSISTDAYAGYTKWATVLQGMKGFNLYNYSHHGCGYIRVIENWPQGDMPHQIEIANTELTAQGVAPDLVILFMGTNDFGAQIPIGAAGDGMDIHSYNKTTYLTPTHEPTVLAELTTFYGGVEHSMARIKQLWPNALVCVLTPLQRLAQTSAIAGMALEDYRNIIIKTARLFAYPIKDLFTDANFSPCNPYDRENKTYSVYDKALGRNTYDGLHPTEAFCRDELAPMIGAFIEDMTSGAGCIDPTEKGGKGDPGEKGDPGDDYVLTEADKAEIAQQAAELIDAVLLPLIGSGVIE